MTQQFCIGYTDDISDYLNPIMIKDLSDLSYLVNVVPMTKPVDYASFLSFTKAEPPQLSVSGVVIEPQTKVISAQDDIELSTTVVNSVIANITDCIEGAAEYTSECEITDKFIITLKGLSNTIARDTVRGAGNAIVVSPIVLQKMLEVMPEIKLKNDQHFTQGIHLVGSLCDWLILCNYAAKNNNLIMTYKNNKLHGITTDGGISYHPYMMGYTCEISKMSIWYRDELCIIDESKHSNAPKFKQEKLGNRSTVCNYYKIIPIKLN